MTDSPDTSLQALCPPNVALRLKAIPENIMNMKEADLLKHADVHDTERKLRAAWAMEYERAIRTGEKMDQSNIYKGIVTIGYYFNYVVGNSFKLAYISRPFADYTAQLEDMLQLGLDEMRRILKMSDVDKDGKADNKLRALKVSITKDLMDRQRGATSRKIEIDSKSMNVNVTKEIKASSMEEIDRKLKELEAPEAIAIEYKDVSDGKESV